MKIGLITYPIKHKKTQEIVKGLIKRNFNDLTLLITNFKKYKKRNCIFNHRPYQFVGLSPLQLKKKYKIKVKKLTISNIKECEKVLICGSGIIKKKLIIKNKILNCHSGLIPQSRGLDAFKWSIINLDKIGNTLHYIDAKIDLGKVISHKITKIYNKDTLSSFSIRHFRSEIEMLVNFDKYLNKKVILKLKKKKPTLRMPRYVEKSIHNIFTKYKKKFITKINV